MQRITIILAVCCFTAKMVAGGACGYGTEPFWGSLSLGAVDGYTRVEHSAGYFCPTLESMQLGPLLGVPEPIMDLSSRDITGICFAEDEVYWIRSRLYDQFLKITVRVSVNDILYTFTQQQLLYFSCLSSLWQALWVSDTENIIRWILACFFQYGFMPNYSFRCAYQSLSHGFILERRYVLCNRLQSYYYLFQDVYNALQNPPLPE